MNFLTLGFAVFYIILIPLLAIQKKVKMRNVLLLTANLVFYSIGDLRSVPLLIAESAACYFAALKIRNEKASGRTGKGYAALMVLAAVAVLILCKYLLFIGSAMFGEGFAERYRSLADIQPIGISFYTLMVISYVVDVYRGRMEACEDFLSVALYVSFFPQIMSGPITKARELMGQFGELHPITKAGVYSGMQIFLTGALKKVLIADRLAVCSNAVYSNPSMYSGLSIFLGTVCYTIQLYCDFSGYTDMAAGVATMMGFRLARNFDLPYIAKNPTETWKRWHISLSSWLQEYVYISLGGNRKGKARQYLNLILTMIVGGLWHGAAWTYILWGLQCGIGLCVHKTYVEYLKKPGKDTRVYTVMSTLATYLYFLAGTIIFRAESAKDAFTIFERIFTGAQGVGYYYVYFFIYFIFVAVAYAVAMIRNNGHGFYVNADMERFGYRVLFLFAVMMVVIYGYFGNNVFIYAQF